MLAKALPSPSYSSNMTTKLVPSTTSSHAIRDWQSHCHLSPPSQCLVRPLALRCKKSDCIWRNASLELPILLLVSIAHNRCFSSTFVISEKHTTYDIIINQPSLAAHNRL
ncbi:hypothetical protein GOP47_0027977 [Adiantum capillus-veneris]|nr:hypothetical protein GOP47_0027977 [Adiantum capillus-veneris]